MRLSNTFEAIGVFWLPEAPTHQVPGVLRVSDTADISLDIGGSFRNPDARSPTLDPGSGLTPEAQQRLRIVGHIEDGSLVTLDDCSYEQNSAEATPLFKIRIHATVLVKGAHYRGNEAITFSEIEFSVEGLETWLSISGIGMTRNWERNTVSIDVKPVPDISYALPDGITLTFTVYGSVSPIPKVKVTEKAFITMRSGTLRPFWEFVSIVAKMVNFLRFAIDEPVAVDSLTGYSNDRMKKLVSGEEQRIPMRLYYKATPLLGAKPIVTRGGMFFGYKKISDGFEKILNNWFKTYETSEPAFNLYFASKSGADQYLESQFLSLAQGIETLHRRNSQSTTMPTDEFSALVDLLVNSAPDDKKQWVGRKLKYANELSLRQRMKEIIEPFKELFGGREKAKVFITSVVNTRNYLTHYDESLAKAAASGETLWKACLKLESLFQLHFLSLMGLDGPFIKSLVMDNRSFRFKLELVDDWREQMLAQSVAGAGSSVAQGADSVDP